MKQWFLIFMLVFGVSCAGKALLPDEDKEKQILELGRALYEDVNLSAGKNQSCETCHHPSAGFSDPANRIDPVGLPVSEGSISGRFGTRNAPTAAYSGFSPVFHHEIPDGEEDDGLFVGGSFWDGRATGKALGDPLAEQAQLPFLNPVEMALGADLKESDHAGKVQEVVDIVKSSTYAGLFLKVFGPGAFEDPMLAFDLIARAIAAFERSAVLNPFNSRFDRFVGEQGGDVSSFGVRIENDGFRRYIGPPEGFQSNALTYDEADGLALFNADSDNAGSAGRAGGMCYACHLTTHHADADGNTYPPLFTDFSYDNLGIPHNPKIAALSGPQPTDYGLGAMVKQLREACPECRVTIIRTQTGEIAMEEAGKFKVPTLRNVEKSAPYGHNGFFPTLHAIVNFYNTRDVGTWDPPEVANNMNDEELGNLGLNEEQERKIVLFMESLTD
jgi:cytochrome c peroxidase